MGQIPAVSGRQTQNRDIRQFHRPQARGRATCRIRPNVSVNSPIHPNESLTVARAVGLFRFRRTYALPL